MIPDEIRETLLLALRQIEIMPAAQQDSIDQARAWLEAQSASELIPDEMRDSIYQLLDAATEAGLRYEVDANAVKAWLDAQDAPAGVVQIADALWRLVEIAEDRPDFVPEAARVRDWLENKRMQPQSEWTPVRVGQWECQCDVCRNEEPDSWHWDFYVNDNGATFGISERDDADFFREITLPPGLRLCERAAKAQPQPDWDDAPSWALWWAVDPDGYCHWFDNEPILTQVTGAPDEIGPRWSHAGRCAHRYDAVNLPLGVDWRTTLQRRPEADNGA